MMAGEPFRGEEIWNKLTADEQAILGGGPLELIVAWHGVAMTPAGGDAAAYETALNHASLGLDLLGWHALARFGVVAPHALPPVPATADRVCRVCGCHDFAACELPPFGDPCAWAEADLCTGCAPARTKEAAG